MPFDPAARARLLAVRGVGPAVIARLEEAWIEDLPTLARQEAAELAARIAARLGTSCWRNSPMARGPGRPDPGRAGGLISPGR